MSAPSRLVPFYCPFCGEESLEPVGEHGGWHCRDCNRAFTLITGGNFGVGKDASS